MGETDKLLKLPQLKSCYCDTCIVYDVPKVTERHRTLDEYPMQHDLADSLRMLQRRRSDDQQRKSNMATSMNESRTLSSYSRRRFESALSARRGDTRHLDTQLKSTSPSSGPHGVTSDAETRSLFYKETTPSWSRPRHHSIAGGEGGVVDGSGKQHHVTARPDSEPPLVTSRGGVWPGRMFDHARGRVEASNPGIRRLYRDYNSGLKVVCAADRDDCQEAWATARRSGRGMEAVDVLLVPVDEGGKQKLLEEVEKDDENIENNDVKDGVSVARLSLGEGEDGDVVEGLDGQPVDGIPEVQGDPIRPMDESGEAGEEATNDGDGRHSPSPPWRCWVDDATVSSIAFSMSEPEVEPISGDTPPLKRADSQGQEDENPIEAAIKGKSLTSAKGKKSKSEEPELPEPPAPEPPAPLQDGVEVVGEVEVTEEVPPPALPLSLCPSDVTKAHQAEVKLWLRKSPFTAARRSVPIFWT